MRPHFTAEGAWIPYGLKGVLGRGARSTAQLNVSERLKLTAARSPRRPLRGRLHKKLRYKERPPRRDSVGAASAPRLCGSGLCAAILWERPLRRDSVGAASAPRLCGSGLCAATLRLPL